MGELFSDFWLNILGGIIATVVGGLILAFIPIDSIRHGFRRFLRVTFNVVATLFRWLIQNWPLPVGLTLLISATYLTFMLTQAVWAIVVIVGLVTSTLLLARYNPAPFNNAIAQAVDTNAFPILSGKAGEFTYAKNGPWTKSVICNPIHGAWQDALKVLPGAKWIWIKGKPTNDEARNGQTVWHRLIFDLTQKPIIKATLSMMVDDYANVFVNDQPIKRVSMVENVVSLDVTPHICPGKNVITMEIENNASSPQATGESNPTGVIYRFDIQ